MKKHIPLIVIVVVVLGLVASLPAPRSKSDAFDLQEFGRLPVLLNGRSQPMDSVARNSLLILRGKQTVPVESEDPKERRTLSAIEWLAEAMMKPSASDTRQIFRIDHPEVKGLLGLAEEEKHFSFIQFESGLTNIENQARRIRSSEIKPESQTPFEKAIMRLQENVILYRRIKNSLQPEFVPKFAVEVAEYEKSIAPGVKAVRDREAGREYDEQAFNTLLGHLSKYDMMAQFAYPLIIPSGTPTHDRDDWSNMGQALMESARNGQIPEPVKMYAAMSEAYVAGNTSGFNKAVYDLRSWLNAHQYQAELSKGRNEHYFNHLEPFYKSTLLYVGILVIALVSWFNQSAVLGRTALWLLGLTVILHSVGLIYRMVLEGRPPVTNLYSSAVFIGWGTALLGAFLERIYRNSIGSVVASLGGFSTLIIAHNLALGGDTMEMMRAVLDTNFWLATHVVVVTLGYSATFLAGLLAILYILRGFFSSTLSEPMAKSLSRMVYGVICFATIASFVGTVLGGIWADQSWGRFWGWDPKENGALMIVIWNAFYLHARWGKILSEKALMATAVFGNVITAFSWFGVNMLGIGLHSYGFMDAAFKWLILVDVIHLAIIIIALLPLEKWRSFGAMRRAKWSVEADSPDRLLPSPSRSES